MAVDNLIELQTFLNAQKEDLSRSDVSYILMLIRKILEASNAQNYPVLRFYCDWAVHTRKDRVSASMKKIITIIYGEVVKDINSGWGLGGPNIKKFTYMENLKDEMNELFNNFKIIQNLTKSDEKWVDFIQNLVKILEKQPIIVPIPEVTKLEFIAANEGCAVCDIYFSNNIKGYSYYRMGNAY